MSTDNENINDNSDNISVQDSQEQKLFWGMTENTYCMLMNLIQLLPCWGVIIAVVMWVMNKDVSQQIDKFGKNTTNWVISIVIYFVVAGVVNTFITVILAIFSVITHAPIYMLGYFISALVFMVLGTIEIIFPIIAAIKANKGIYWKYPLSIQFIK